MQEKAQATGNTDAQEALQPYLTPEATRSLDHRLARIEGHVGALRRMVAEHRCADEILLQVAAVKAALNQVSGELLDRELTACMTSCMAGDADERLGKVTRVLTTLLKQT